VGDLFQLRKGTPVVTDLSPALHAVLATQQAGEDIETYGVRRRVTTIRADTGGEIRQVDQSEIVGIGVRLVRADRSGYASTTDFSQAGLMRCVDQARSHAALSMPDPSERLPAADALPPAHVASEQVVAIEDRIAMTAELARTATSLDPRVRVIDNATYSSEVFRVEIASTLGLRLLHERSFAEAWVDVVGDDGATTASGSGYWWGGSHAGCDPLLIATAAVEKATRLLGRRADLPAHSATLLVPGVTAVLIAAAGRALVAPTVRSRRGPLPGGIGAVVAAPAVTLVDDGRHLSSRRAAPFDDEGVTRESTPLITAGAISGMLQSSATTRDDERSTGNALRGSYKSPPGLAPTTLTLDSTAATTDLAVTGEVAVIQQLSGDQSGVSPVTGRIDIAVSGYLLREGDHVGAFVAVPVSTNLVNLLRHIDAVGDDARVIYRSPALSPTVRLAPGWLA
jgi:PmbA protein